MSAITRLRTGYVYKRARRRLRKINGDEVLSWTDSGVWATQEALAEYRRSLNVNALTLAQDNLVTLLAAVDDLLDRRK